MKCIMEFSRAAFCLLQLDQALDSERTVVWKSKGASAPLKWWGGWVIVRLTHRVSGSVHLRLTLKLAFVIGSQW